MPRTAQPKRHRQSIEAQIALADRILRGLHKSIDEKIERARDLEVERALALYKAGKNPACDGDEFIQQMRRRVG